MMEQNGTFPDLCSKQRLAVLECDAADEHQSHAKLVAHKRETSHLSQVPHIQVLMTFG